VCSSDLEFSGAAASVITLPTPEGHFDQFAYWESPVMAPELAAKFPEIETFVGRGIDDPTASVRFDLTPQGFHAQVLSPTGIYYVDPFYHLQADGPYVSYFRTDYLSDANDTFSCLIQDIGSAHDENDHDEDAPASSAAGEVSSTSSSATELGGNLSPLLTHGSQLRTYELAVASTGEYTTYHGGTVQLAMAAIVTTVNRVDGIYEDDIAVRMELVANNDQLVYTNSSTDPYSNSNGYAMLDQNQTTIDSVIGSANYDIGHVFSTGGGGVAGLGVIGDDGSKARGVTGQGSPIGDPFDIDYVAHEMGHQFGANHTFNGNNGNRNASTAMEPGSASTIMGYAGIMGSDDLQSNSDPYFHSISLDEMVAEITTGNANAAATITNTGNNLPTVDAGADYTIPAATPFVLTATGSDADAGDVLTYTWEQRDLGPAQGVNNGDNGSSPLFRSWNPTTSPERVFPRLSDVLDGSTVVGETLPTTDRDMNFRVTIRDSRSGGGGINTDDMLVTVVDTGSPFAVTSPNTAVSWTGNTTQTVTWDVASTDSGSINTSLVDILVSTDGGATFSAVASNVANDGSHDITVPNTATSEARLKVQAVGNIFFDISDADFTILESSTSALTVVIAAEAVSEAAGAAATTGTVSLSSATSGDLVVSLASDDTSEATVPSSVTILDGNSSASFDIDAVDDALVDGTQTVIVTASATGYTSGTDTLNVTDDETATGPVIIDNGDADFTQTNFEYYTGTPAYEGDNHSWQKNTGAGEATWTFSGLASGEYQVATTWYEKYNRATDAPYTIEDGSGGVLATATVNQISAPNDFNESGTNWEQLATVSVTGGSLVVKLNESPTNAGWVIADAVRIEKTAAAGNGQIAGTVWDDADGDGTIDGSESLLEGWFVFLDQNQNGSLDTTETALQTDSNGAYLFENLVDDTYYVTEILPDGWEQTTPSGSARGSTASLGTVQVVGGESFSTDVLPNWTASLGSSQLIGQSLRMMGTVQQWGDDVSLASVQSAALMNADDFRADPLFVGFDGTGFATVIIDSGADLDHSFFGADADSNGVSDRIVYQYDFGNDDTDASDVDGHGTNVAGIAASSDSTYTGTAPGADIIVLKVFADSGSGSFNDVEDALQWVVSNATTYNIASINMSLGDGGTYNSSFSAEILSDELASLVAMDVIVVSAAGNEFTTAGTEGISYPAADISSLAVSAVWDGNNGGPFNWSGGTTDHTTAADRVTSFSSRSSTLTDIFAPGAYISNAGLSGGVSSYAGTSQAAPQVAGIAVVAQQLATATLGRSLTQAEFRSLLQSTGTTINDGDDEDDNVTNTGADYSRVDMWALMRGILATAASGGGVHDAVVSGGNSVTGLNFGNRVTSSRPVGEKPGENAGGSRTALEPAHLAASMSQPQMTEGGSSPLQAAPDAIAVDGSDNLNGRSAAAQPRTELDFDARRRGMLLAARPQTVDNDLLSTWVDSMFADEKPVSDTASFEIHATEVSSATSAELIDQLLAEKDLWERVDALEVANNDPVGEADVARYQRSLPLDDDVLDIFCS
jgi:hypothetical protein